MKQTSHNIVTTIIAAVIGVVVGIVGTYTVLVQRVTKAEDAISALEKQASLAFPKTDSPEIVSVSLKAKPEKLNEIIRAEQTKYVKESSGQFDYQCFTEVDLDSFVTSNRPQQAVAELRKNNDFLDVVLAVKAMAPSERQHLLDASRQLSHPTWAELGKISVEGQTNAGQKAERLLAGAIVAEVERLIGLSDREIRKLYV